MVEYSDNECQFNKNGSCLYYDVIKSELSLIVAELDNLINKNSKIYPKNELEQIKNRIVVLGERC